MIRNWAVLDLNVFRRYEDDPYVRKEIQDNRDGTHFIAYDIRSFPRELVVGVSPTMAMALERGVHAVEPLPIIAKTRKLIAPPDLQALVLAHAVYDETGKMIGGYDRITPEAWARFDADMAAWKDLVRLGNAETTNEEEGE
jgi:hypothetical protein